jgi:hypothetical protein
MEAAAPLSSSQREKEQRTKKKAASSRAAAPRGSAFDFDSYGKKEGWSHVPEDRDQAVVMTPYGRGTVIRTRREGNLVEQLGQSRVQAGAATVVMMREVELTDWTSAAAAGPTGTRRPATMTLYSPVDFESVPPQLHDEVVCPFGRGRVTEIRAQDETLTHTSSNTTVMVVVLLSSWRLAGRSKVTCYLSSASVKVVRPKRLYEMSVHEKVEHAQELKSRANKLFSSSSNCGRGKNGRQRRASCHYREALDLYVRAIESVRYVQHKADSPNELRADLLVLLITCYNNAGMCCSLLLPRDDCQSGGDGENDRYGNRWDDAARYAGSALTLIEALEEKRGLKIHTLLNREGTPDAKLFGEWKVKALVLKARALMERRNADVDQAAELLKQAHGAIACYRSAGSANGEAKGSGSSSALLSMEKEVIRLRASCKERRKRLREREKKQALKMFATANYEEEKKEKSSPDSSPPSSPVHVEDGEPRFQSIGAVDDHAGDGETSSRPSSSADTFDGRKKRVSFSDHVSERLYQPEERRSKADRTIYQLRVPAVIGSGLWAQRSQTALYAGLGLAVGALLALANIHWAPRVKR